MSANETLDDNQPSHPEKLDDSADKSKPKETEVVVEPDVSVEGEESKDENKEADEVEQVHDVIRDSQHDEVVDFEIDNTKSAMVSNVINPNVQSAPLICVQTEATPVTDCIVPASKYHNESMVAFERIMDAATEIQISENEPLEVDTWSSQTSLIQHHYYYLISELDVSDTNSYMLTKVWCLLMSAAVTSSPIHSSFLALLTSCPLLTNWNWSNTVHRRLTKQKSSLLVRFKRSFLNALKRLKDKFDTALLAPESTSLVRGMVIRGIPFDF
ncbi:unnamed protein product [Trifolium pratense]|uniref:Uncharacterized protein n=1 Tax=Trifolium pratense TaxID=57577 RepID=A0ACB0L0Y2_TRIPR|nr:unnamed protein product [Trifolium pratense]